MSDLGVSPATTHVLEGHKAAVSGCAVTADGSLLVSASWDGTLKIWDAENGRERATLHGHAGPVTGCAISADGMLIASAGQDRTLRVWDRQGRERCVLEGHAAPVTDCDVNRNGSFLVSASSDGTLKLWDAATAQLLGTLQGHTGGVEGCALSADGSLIASAGTDGTVRVWDRATMAKRDVLVGHELGVAACAFGEGRRVVSGGHDGTIRIWHGGRESATLTGHAGPVNGCTTAQDGDFVVSAGQDGTVRVWDCSEWRRQLATLDGHDGPVNDCAIAGDAGFIVSAGQDGTLRIWDVAVPALATAADARAVDVAVEEFQSIMNTAQSRGADPAHLEEIEIGLCTLREWLAALLDRTSGEAHDRAVALAEAVDGEWRQLAGAKKVVSHFETFKQIARSVDRTIETPEQAHQVESKLRKLRTEMDSTFRDDLGREGRSKLNELATVVDGHLEQLASALELDPVQPLQETGVTGTATSPVDHDSVDCTVFAPPVAAPGDQLLVQVFAHTPEQGPAAAALAQEFDTEAKRRGFASLEIMVAEGTRLSFLLAMPGLIIDEAVQTVVWRRRPASVQFEVQVPDDHNYGTVIGTVAISADGIPVGHVKFKLEIVRKRAFRRRVAAEPRGTEAKRYAMAFVSYASQDRDEVIRRVQMLKALGIGFFQDVILLDPGERWEKRLYEQIDECDLFLLFWSSAAKGSEWVKREVEYAMARKGDDDFAPPEIRPIIVEGPPVIPPWEELSHLHFNDLLVYLIDAEGAKQTKGLATD